MLIQLTQNPLVLPTSTATVVPNWEYAHTASTGTDAPVRSTRAPCAVVESNTRPSLADVGALWNFQVAGFAPLVLRRSDCRLGSAGSICVAVAGARVTEVVVYVKLMIFYPIMLSENILVKRDCECTKPAVARRRTTHPGRSVLF